MAANAQLVAVWVAEISAVVVGVIVRPKPRGPLTSGATHDRSRVATVYGISARSKQRHHLPIARCGGLTIVGTPNQEEGSILTGLYPPGPLVLRLEKLECITEFIHHAAIKLECALDDSNSDMHVRQHCLTRAQSKNPTPNVLADACSRKSCQSNLSSIFCREWGQWRRAASRRLGPSKNWKPALSVRDANGQKLGYFYYEEEPGRRSAAKMLTKDEATDRGEYCQAAGAVATQKNKAHRLCAEWAIRCNGLLAIFVSWFRWTSYKDYFPAAPHYAPCAPCERCAALHGASGEHCAAPHYAPCERCAALHDASGERGAAPHDAPCERCAALHDASGGRGAALDAASYRALLERMVLHQTVLEQLAVSELQHLMLLVRCSAPQRPSRRPVQEGKARLDVRSFSHSCLISGF
jgi:hypothetical protein